MQKIDNLLCKVCGRKNFKYVFKNKDRMHHFPSSFDFYRCNDCGVCTYFPRLEPDVLGGYYPKDYYSYVDTETRGAPSRRDFIFYALHPFCAANALFYSKILGQNRDASFQPNQAVLDIGCGDGRYLLQDNKNLCRIYGVDIDEKALNRLKSKKPEANIFCDNLWEAKYPDDFFDFIHLSHVVEHVEEADRLLAEVARIVRQDGRVKLQIPNTASLTRVFFGTFWIHWDAPRHIHGFSRKNFSILVSSVGLEVVACRTIENSFSVLGSFFYLFNAIVGRKQKLTEASKYWDNEILKFLLFPYCFFVNALGVGDTIEFILKKKPQSL